MRTTTVLVSILTSTVIAACGDHSPASPDAADPDAPPDTPLPLTTITVNTDAPSLIAYRDGSGPWQAPPETSPGIFNLDVHGPYIVTVVCDDGIGDITTTQLAQTPNDDHDVFLFCGTSGATNQVTGHMVQPGQITIDFSSFDSTVANWDFMLDVATGQHDLVAVNDAAIAVRHGLAVNGATAVTPAIDVVQEGASLVAAPLGATNAVPGETVNGRVSLITKAFTFATVYSGDAALTKVAPDAVLGVGDQQRAGVIATTATSSRSVQRRSFHAGDNGQLALPIPLGPTTFTTTGGTLEVTWTTLPDNDFLDGSLFAFTDDFSTFWFHELQISASYVVTAGATSSRFDEDIPGFKPEWKIGLSKPYSRGFEAIRFEAAQIATSGMFEDVNALARHARPLTERVAPRGSRQASSARHR